MPASDDHGSGPDPGPPAAFALVGVAMSINGSPLAFWNLPSVLIVVLEPLRSPCLSQRPKCWAWRSSCARCFRRSGDSLRCRACLELGRYFTAPGHSGLDRVLPQLSGERFLQRAIAMAVEGASPDQITQVLTTEIESTSERMSRSANVLRRAAEVSPAMGLIGTLIGLIQMLAGLNDPSTIGPAMAWH